MTKLFIQLMFSVILGLGAAMGFSPKVRTDVHDTVLQANASLHESVTAAVKNMKKGSASITTAVSVKTHAEASAKSSAKDDLNLKDDLKAKINARDVSPVNVLPDLSGNTTLTNGAQTNLEVDPSGLDLGVKDKINSTLTLNPGAGR